MAHENGRCASAAETIYVENTASCTDLPGTTTGTRGAPLCSLDSGFIAVTYGRRLIVVRGTVAGPTSIVQLPGTRVSIVGAAPGALLTDHGLAFEDTDVFIRGLTISNVPEAALAVTGGSLTARDLTISENAGGGILVDGAGFAISNASITSNGLGIFGSAVWGGILVQGAPASALTELTLVTLANNMGPGLLCGAGIKGTGVFAIGNTTLDILPTCEVDACAAPGPDCGAQLTAP